jgi:hypothetical protein
MSGAGEALAGIAAVASISQILAYCAKTMGILAKFCNDVKDAPSELRRLEHKILLLHHGFGVLETFLSDVDDEELFSVDIRVPMQAILLEVDTIVHSLREGCLNHTSRRPDRFRTRFQFALSDRRTMDKTLERLRQAEQQLGFFAQLVHM